MKAMLKPHMQTKSSFRSGSGFFALPIAMLAGLALLLPGHVRAAEDAAGKEQKFLAVLQSSSAPPQEKAMACKQLAIYGSSKSVPALAALLGNPELASWARIALEVIPDPSADKALRDALPGLNGKLLVGAINSIGRRHDAGAVPVLVAHLKHADVEVASAAAAALGQIGGPDAASALKTAMANSKPEVKSAVAEGLVRAAEQFLASGKKSEAMDLYDFVRKSDVPKQRIAEAIRGAILARGEAGVPLLLDQLKSPDKTMVAVGLRVARELEGRGVTAALSAAMKQLEPARQPLLLMAIGDRNDSAVLPAVRDAARAGSKELQLAAIGILENIGDVSCVSDLLLLAAGPDADLAKAAKSTLAKMGSSDVDNEIIARLSKSTGVERRVLIETASQRQLVKALPAITTAISDADPATRTAAVQAVTALGGAAQVPELAGLVAKTADEKELDAFGQALVAVCGRAGSSAVTHVLPLTKNDKAAVRIVALQALAAAGGPEALAAVTAALNDSNETVQDEAVRTLSTWPNNWPEDTAVATPLLQLVNSGKKPSHQILAARGYLECVRGDKKLTDEQKLGKVKDLLPLMKLPEEKRLAVTVLGSLPIAGSLDLLVSLTSDSAVAEEACSAIVSLASKNLPGVAKEQRKKALETAAATSANEATKKKCQEALDKIR